MKAETVDQLCVCVCMYVCAYVFLCMYLYACTHTHTHTYTHTCTHTHTHIHTRTHTRARTHTHARTRTHNVHRNLRKKTKVFRRTCTFFMHTCASVNSHSRAAEASPWQQNEFGCVPNKIFLACSERKQARRGDTSHTRAIAELNDA